MNGLARILLVEDNKHDIELTLDAFSQVQLANEIQVIETGDEALNFLLGHGEFADREKHPLPDLVLLDLKLPGIDGIEILRRTKETPIIKRIPVIVLTSSEEEGDRALSYDIGANSYLVKPVSFNDFLKVAQLVGNYWLSLNVAPPKDR